MILKGMHDWQFGGSGIAEKMSDTLSSQQSEECRTSCDLIRSHDMTFQLIMGKLAAGKFTIVNLYWVGTLILISAKVSNAFGPLVSIISPCALPIAISNMNMLPRNSYRDTNARTFTSA